MDGLFYGWVISGATRTILKRQTQVKRLFLIFLRESIYQNS